MSSLQDSFRQIYADRNVRFKETSDDFIGPVTAGAIKAIHSIPEYAAHGINRWVSMFQDRNPQDIEARNAQSQRIEELFAAPPWFSDKLNAGLAQYYKDSPEIVDAVELLTPTPSKVLPLLAGAAEEVAEYPNGPLVNTARRGYNSMSDWLK